MSKRQNVKKNNHEPEKLSRKEKEPGYWRKLWLILGNKEKYQLLGLLILQIIGSMIEIVGLGAIPAFILALANPAKIYNHRIAGKILSTFGVSSTEELLVFGVVSLILIFVLKNIYTVIIGFVKANYLRNLQVRYGLALFHKYMYADYLYLLGHNTSELLRNCLTEVSQVVLGILQGILNLFMDIVLVFNILLVLFIMEPASSLFILLIIGSISFSFLRFTRRKMERLGSLALSARKEIVQAMDQGLDGIKETRIMHSEEFFIGAYHDALQKMTRSERIRAMYSSTIRPLFETLAVISLLMITLIMYYQKKSLDSIIPILSVFSVAMIRLLPAIREITSTLSMLRYSFVSLNPIYESKDIPQIPTLLNSSLSSEAQLADRIRFNSKITLESISYFYPNSPTPAVDDIAIEVKKGEIVAFVGSSGAGKTTLLDVISGLLVPQTGMIKVDDVDITRDVRLWQRHLGYIPQFIFLADATLKENILWGMEETMDNRKYYEIAIKAAQLEDLIDQLPSGDKTMVGERGTRLSGGQRQRIGIARALFRNPDVLIMDEATASLDSITEQEIANAIDGMKGSRTMFIVAHRLSTVRNCDKIFLMENGRIIDTGSYDQLFETNAKFRALHGSFVNHSSKET